MPWLQVLICLSRHRGCKRAVGGSRVLERLMEEESRIDLEWHPSRSLGCSVKIQLEKWPTLSKCTILFVSIELIFESSSPRELLPLAQQECNIRCKNILRCSKLANRYVPCRCSVTLTRNPVKTVPCKTTLAQVLVASTKTRLKTIWDCHDA